MNSIDAIIALCALTAGFGLLLGAVNETQKASNDTIDSLKAKTTALACAGIIDSMITNSAHYYTSEISCAPEGKTVKATQNMKDKNASILGQAIKKPIFEVEVEKHYFD